MENLPRACFISYTLNTDRSKRKRFYRIRDVDIIPPPSDNIPIKRRSKALVDKLVAEGGSSITVIENNEIPEDHIAYPNIEGLIQQKVLIQEAVEVPLNYYEYCLANGIKSPSLILLDGPEGSGKAKLVNAVAHHTNALFIRIDGPMFIQKCLRKGAFMINSLFAIAKENSPAIIFINEIDVIGHADAELQVKHILKELLDNISDVRRNNPLVKVILATNDDSNWHPQLLDFHFDKIIYFS